MVLPTDEVGKPARRKNHQPTQPFLLNSSLMADSTYNASNTAMSALHGMITRNGLPNNLHTTNQKEFALNNQPINTDEDAQTAAFRPAQWDGGSTRPSRVKSAPYNCSQRAMGQETGRSLFLDDEALTSAVCSLERLAGRFDRACLLTDSTESHAQQTLNTCDMELTARSLEQELPLDTFRSTTDGQSQYNHEFEVTNKNLLLAHYLDDVVGKGSSINQGQEGVACRRKASETCSIANNVTLNNGSSSAENLAIMKCVRPNSAKSKTLTASIYAEDDRGGFKPSTGSSSAESHTTINSSLSGEANTIQCGANSCDSLPGHEVNSSKTPAVIELLGDAKQSTSRNLGKSSCISVKPSTTSDEIPVVNRCDLQDQSSVHHKETDSSTTTSDLEKSHCFKQGQRLGDSGPDERSVASFKQEVCARKTGLEKKLEACSGEDSYSDDPTTEDGMDFDVYNLDTNLHQLNWEKFEQQLQIALEKEEQSQQKNDRDEIRRRLASDIDDTDSLPSFCRPARRSALSSRSHYGPVGYRGSSSGSSLQVCFLNEASAALEAELDLQRDLLSGSSLFCGTMSDLEKQLKVNVSQGQSISTSRERSPFDYKSSSPSPTAALLASCRMSLSPTWPGDETDFVTRQARLQAEARLALAQVRPLARMQLLLEKQAKRKSAIADIIGAEMFEDGKLKKLTLPVLQHMNYGQLQVLVNDLHAQIESHNVELMQLLQERDDLHMAQDSMLVDIEDLTRRAKEYEARIRRSRNLSEASQ